MQSVKKPDNFSRTPRFPNPYLINSLLFLALPFASAEIPLFLAKVRKIEKKERNVAQFCAKKLSRKEIEGEWAPFPSTFRSQVLERRGLLLFLMFLSRGIIESPPPYGFFNNNFCTILFEGNYAMCVFLVILLMIPKVPTNPSWFNPVPTFSKRRGEKNSQRERSRDQEKKEEKHQSANLINPYTHRSFPTFSSWGYPFPKRCPVKKQRNIAYCYEGIKFSLNSHTKSRGYPNWIFLSKKYCILPLPRCPIKFEIFAPFGKRRIKEKRISSVKSPLLLLIWRRILVLTEWVFLFYFHLV